MRKMMGWLIALLMMCGSAVAEAGSAALVDDVGNHARRMCTGAGGQHGRSCTIVALRDGSVQIDLTARQEEYSVSFRAVFDGGRAREQIDSVTLNELTDEALRLSWVAIDFCPAGEEQKLRLGCRHGDVPGPL